MKKTICTVIALAFLSSAAPVFAADNTGMSPQAGETLPHKHKHVPVKHKHVIKHSEKTKKPVHVVRHTHHPKKPVSAKAS